MAKPKIEPKIIRVQGRASFLNATEPKYRTDKFGRPIKVRPDGSAVKPQYRMTWLIDPSSPEGQATIKEVKAEAARQLDIYHDGRENWPKDNAQTGTKGILLCFGNGNDLPKVYDGYKDMFFIKVADTQPPIIGDRRGRQIALLGDNAWHVVDLAATKKTGQLVTTEETVGPGEVPYSGAFCTGTINLYIYNNESHGVNANFRSIQFLRTMPSFGGGAPRTAAEELQAMAGDAPGTKTAAFDDDIPF